MHTEKRPREDTVRSRHLQARQASEETNSADIVTVKSEFLLFKPPNL